MFDDEPVAPASEDLRLRDEDFPTFYLNFAHPEDYIIRNEPVPVECIFHQHNLRHPRILLRISVRLTESQYMAVTFVLDTGAPKVYTSQRLHDVLSQYNIERQDEDLGIEYISLFGKKYACERTPEGHSPANIIGLKTLCNWGLQLTDSPEFAFSFAREMDYLEA